MKVKELKKYLKNFRDTDTVSVALWASDGQHYFTPHTPCCNPIRFESEDGDNIAVIGCADFCLAHQVIRAKD